MSENNVTCPICGKKFHLKPSKLIKGKNHYCSRECHRVAKMEYMKGDKNHQYGLRGSKNPTWKSDRKLSRYGYRQVRCLDHPFKDHADFVFEHRLVAEQYLLNNDNSVVINGKRYLSPDYVVHHKDFDRLNNSPDNLEVMTHEEHQRLHTTLNPAKRNPVTGRFEKMTDVIKVKKTTPSAVLPKRSTAGAACYDLYADIDKAVEIKPHSTEMLQTHVAFEFPEEYCGLVFARSGISTKRHLRPSTCVSVIDSDYRGGVGLPIHNDSDEIQTVQPRERVVQLMFIKPIRVELQLADELAETERGDNGFGSSGR